jgi:putative protease
MERLELLAPAGDLDKLKTAVDYGADAVYFGGEVGSLRAAAGNLSVDDIREGVHYCHRFNRKSYLTLNIYAHNEDLKDLRNFVDSIKDIDIDAFIVSDPAIINILKSTITNPEIHLSTQANVTSYGAANFWYNQGIKRLVLARELTIKEITAIHENIPNDMELEAFVHGAMCISYSGRCLLSNFLADRDGNRGECAQPCRWNYSLVEEQRPNEYFPIEEDSRGTYIMNSKDLCMIRHIPELIKSGVISAKIEGRMKSSYYVATVIRTYRRAIDEYYKDPENYSFNENWWAELLKASHREFTTGFFFHKSTGNAQNYLTSGYTRGYTFLGIVKGYDEEKGLYKVEQRNKISIGDNIEVFGPSIEYDELSVDEMWNQDMEPIETAPHAQQIIYMNLPFHTKSGFMLRRK